MMKSLFLFFFCISLTSFEATSRKPLTRALGLIEKGDFLKGSQELYRLSSKKSFRTKKVQMKYTLGIALSQMGFYHMASLQFIYVIKSNNSYYRKKAATKLIGLAETLGDRDFIYYILGKVKARNFPPDQQDKLNFYFGVFEFNKKNYSKSRSYFSKLSEGASFYNKAVYQTALSYAEEGRPLKAARIFNQLSNSRSGITDQIRVAAIMGEARSFYQAKKFNKSLKAYRMVPKDTKYWHDILLESSWAYLRSAKFRSALSNFQTLHSGFYEGHYQPESLILRSYVYLYICKYYEMEKVLDLFNAVYLPTLKSVKGYLKNRHSFRSYLNTMLQSGDFQSGKKSVSSSVLPSVIIQRISGSSEFQSVAGSLKSLKEEQGRLQAMPYHWVSSRVGRNTAAVIKARVATMKKRAEKLSQITLMEIQEELERLTKLEQYLRYDMLRGKREAVKKRIRRKYSDSFQIDEKFSRDYYIKNGYEYWPFMGENWLDELGNYHYIGLQSCE